MSRTTAVTLCAVAVVTGAIFRVAAMRGDLSFDEVWSIALAGWAGSPLRIFTSLHLDNNHYLNTLAMQFLLPLDWHSAYRIPSVLASVVTIVLAAVYGARHSRIAAVSCAVLHAFSFLLIQYGTEARGYSLALCMVVAAMLVLERESDVSPRRLLLFSALTGIGILAHLTFLLFAVPATAMVIGRAIRLSPDRASMSIRLAALGSVPSIVLAFLWWFDLRHLRIAGGPVSSVFDAMTQLAALVFGIWHGPLLGVAAIAACSMLLILLVPEARANQRVPLLIAAAALLLALVLVPGEMAYPRYFLVPFELGLLALGRGLGAVRSPSYRWFGISCLLLVTATNTAAVIDLATSGRGHYRRALSFIAAESHGGGVGLGSDHDLRNGVIFQFYALRIPGGERLIYLPNALQGGPAADWLIFHDTDVDAPAPPAMIEVRGARYALAHSEGHAGLSGFTWHLFRRVHGER